MNYLDLGDYLVIAGAVLGQEPETAAFYTNLPLAESAVMAPAAEFARVEFYPSLPAKRRSFVGTSFVTMRFRMATSEWASWPWWS